MREARSLSRALGFRQTGIAASERAVLLFARDLDKGSSPTALSGNLGSGRSLRRRPLACARHDLRHTDDAQPRKLMRPMPGRGAPEQSQIDP